LQISLRTNRYQQFSNDSDMESEGRIFQKL
jgi:hypothetical protein